MKNKKTLAILLLLTIPIISTVAIALAAGSFQRANQNQTNHIPSEVFTYQGELLDGNEPEPGPCDFGFSLWDSLELGSQIGITQTLSSVPLYDGRFTVQLNDSHQFDIHPFDGTPRYLAIEVDCPSGGGAFVPLSPRQPLTPAPYSHNADTAGSAPWNGITSMPDGFADGIDDDTLYDAGTGLELITGTFQLDASYQLPQSCDLGRVVEWTGATWGCTTPTSWEGPSYAGVIVVAKNGGAFDTIQGALDSIGDATSENRYLVWVAPGVYSETVTMKSYVDIEGAGANLTKIMSGGFSVTHEATVVAKAHTELRSLTVENFGGDTQTIPILSNADDFSLRDAVVFGHGGTSSNFGLHIVGVEKTNKILNTIIQVDVQNPTVGSTGIYVVSSAGNNKVVIQDVTINMTGSANGDISGIDIHATSGYSGTITATRIMVHVNNVGTGDGIGILTNGVDASLTLIDSDIIASGGGADSSGLYGSNGATVSASNVDIEVSHRALFLFDNNDPVRMSLDRSRIRGGIHAIYFLGSAAHELSIGASMLDGSTNSTATSILTCIGSYDENYSNGNGYTDCP